MTSARSPVALGDSDVVLLPAEGESLGQYLRRCRQARSASIEQVAAAVRVPAVHLAAIEEDRPGSIPGRPYYVGFARTFARHVGADEAAAMALARRTAEATFAPPPLIVREPAAERRFPTSVPVGLLVLAGLVAYASWYWQAVDRHVRREMVPPVPSELLAEAAPAPDAVPADRPDAPAAPAAGHAEYVPTPMAPPTEASAAEMARPELARPEHPGTASARAATLAPPPAKPDGRAGDAPPAAEPQAPAPQAVAALQPAPPVAAAAQPRIVLKAEQDCWIMIRNTATGKVVKAEVLRAGSTFAPPTGREYRLKLGNAGGLTLVLDGKPLPHFTGRRGVVSDIPLDGDALAAGWKPGAGD